MKRSIRLQYNAPVTLTFFFLSLASLVLGYLTNNWTTSHLFSVYRSSMTDPLFYVRLFGHVLGHSGWIFHREDMQQRSNRSHQGLPLQGDNLRAFLL